MNKLEQRKQRENGRKERKRVNNKAKLAKSEDTEIIDLLGAIIPGLLLSPSSYYPIGDHPNDYLASFLDDEFEEGSAAVLGDAAESTWIESCTSYARLSSQFYLEIKREEESSIFGLEVNMDLR